MPEYLVCAHAGYGAGTVLGSGWPDWRAELFLTGASPFLVSRAWAARGARGAVTFLLDARMTDNDAGHAAYHSAKRMLLRATRLAARAFAPAVRVNAAAPGLVLPPDDADGELVDKARRAALLDRTGSPDALIDAILFLLRSAFITGEVLFVDGGRNLRGTVY